MYFSSETEKKYFDKKTVSVEALFKSYKYKFETHSNPIFEPPPINFT